LARLCVAVAAVSAAIQVGPALIHSQWNKERLFRLLANGNRSQRVSAALDLAELRAQDQLLRALRLDSGFVRDAAANALARVWHTEAGDEALRELRTAARSAERHEYMVALGMLNEVVSRHPAFAEAWNQRSVVYLRLGNLEKAVSDSRHAVALNPYHFAAWQCLGISQSRQGDFQGALRSFREALRIAPHDMSTRQFLRRLEDMQRQFHPGRPRRDELV
jgi:Flp pilus assembly protein TadD